MIGSLNEYVKRGYMELPGFRVKPFVGIFLASFCLFSSSLSLAQVPIANQERTPSNNSMDGGDGNSNPFDIYREAMELRRQNRYQEALDKLYLTLQVHRQQSYGENAQITTYQNYRLAEKTLLDEIVTINELLGSYARALEAHQQSLEISREFGSLPLYVAALNKSASFYRILGQYQKALENHVETIRISNQAEASDIYCEALIETGKDYLLLDNPRKALEYFEHPSFSEANDPSGENPSCISFTSSKAESLIGIGLAYSDLSRYPEALIFFDQALSTFENLRNQTKQSEILSYLGDVLNKQGEYSKSLARYQQSLAIARELNSRPLQSTALYGIGNAYNQLGQYADAETALLEALEAFEFQRTGLLDIDKVTLLNTQNQAYTLLQRVLVNQNKFSAALEISERGRARALIDLLTSRLRENTNQVSPEVATLQRIQQIAKTQNATLVEYSIVSDNELFIWVITPNGEVKFHQTDLSNLGTSFKELVTTSRTAIGVRSARQFIAVVPTEETVEQSIEQQNQRLQQLYQVLIQPIAEHLPNDPNASVIFIPHGELFLVPFAALQSANGQYLIEQHKILTSPSIQVLEIINQQAQRVSQSGLQDVLIVGNPTMPRIPPIVGDAVQQLTPLPGAESEARAIAPLFEVQPLIGNQATKTTVVQRMTTARMIHLATHGLFKDDLQALESAIALAPDGTGERNDGLLTAAELSAMNLRAELVVLSACDTGQGLVTGDGVLGLSRSLITAGVPSVVVSLWAIDDNSTSVLMTEFYKNLQQNMDKAQALRQAMLTTKEQYPNPLNWAAFTLIGEAE